MDRLVAVVEALRDHCPWTAALTHGDLAEYLVEEAYEAVAEIEARDAAAWADVPARRADGAKDIGPCVAGIARRAGTGSPLGPGPGERPLLAHSGLVLVPHLQWLAACCLWQGGLHRSGKVF